MTVKLTRTAAAVASALVMLSPAGLAATGGGAAWAQAVVRPADISPCIWNAVSVASRKQFLAAPDLSSAIDGLRVMVEAEGEEAFMAILSRCGVTDETSGDAGTLFGGYTGRLWAEGKLSGRWSAATLDKAYGRLSAAELAALNADDDDAAVPAMERFLASLDAEQADEETAILLLAYVFARAQYDKDLAAFGR